MVIDLDDSRLRCRINPLDKGRMRLILDYPAEPDYRNAVLAAVWNLLAPDSPTPPQQPDCPCEREAAP